MNKCEWKPEAKIIPGDRENEGSCSSKLGDKRLFVCNVLRTRRLCDTDKFCEWIKDKIT